MKLLCFLLSLKFVFFDLKRKHKCIIKLLLMLQSRLKNTKLFKEYNILYCCNVDIEEQHILFVLCKFKIFTAILILLLILF